MMRSRLAFGIGALVAMGGCELEEVSLAEVQDVVIAEVYVNLMPDPTNNEVTAFLHRTVGLADQRIDDLLAAVVTVRRDDGLTFLLDIEDASDCVDTSPEPDSGACFFADDAIASQLAPGDLLEVTIDLVDGGRLEGAARVPGAFSINGIDGACRIPPDEQLLLTWSRSERAWAYLNETSIRDLPRLLATEGITMSDDPLYLMGLSISDTDTTIVYPSEFGVFNRFDLQQDVAVRLQRGLPNEATAQITIRAVEKNYVNWARGGSFNPSGRVRVPSLGGDGTGVFGATYGHSVETLILDNPRPGLPDCGPLPPT